MRVRSLLGLSHPLYNLGGGVAHKYAIWHAIILSIAALASSGLPLCSFRYLQLAVNISICASRSSSRSLFFVVSLIENHPPVTTGNEVSLE